MNTPLPNFSMKTLLAGRLNSLRYVPRFSTFPMLHPESTAEHSYFVAFYALQIGFWACHHGTDINLEDVMGRALLHDVEEASTGDVIAPYKHSNPTLEQTLHDASKAVVQDMFERLWPKSGDFGMLLTQVWKSAKDKTPEGAVVALADYLSSVQAAIQEVLMGNQIFLQRLPKFANELRDFHAMPHMEFLFPLIDDAIEVISLVTVTPLSEVLL